MPIFPPGFVTRSSSAAAISWCGANIAPSADIVTSNDASSNGRASASAWSHSSSTPSCRARSWPGGKSSGVRSEAMTSAPAAAAGMAALPVPAPTSSTRWPGPMPSSRTMCSLSSATTGAIWEKSPEAHMAR